MKKTILLLSCFFLVLSSSATNFWTNSSEQHVPVLGEQKIKPTTYLLSKLDVEAFQLFQSSIPKEVVGVYPIIELQNPVGGTDAFYVYENATMSPELSAKYPMIRTYTLVKVGDPLVTGKLDFTLWGLHAVVYNRQHTYFIDPYKHGNQEWYVIYYKSNYEKNASERMECLVDEDDHLQEHQIPLTNDIPALNISRKTFGTEKRNYRLALACTIEYSAAVGGTTPTKASVLSAMVTSMNRVNGVFEREFSMTATLIGNTDNLIYLPGTSDPYSNSNGSTMLGQNQTTVNSVIGSANYDFGHVFSTGGGGIASLASVCSNNNKARGVTGSSNPIGDPFDIDYVAHEMGHQFGGSHTFNSVLGSCSGNGSSQSAYEPGSGTTIQSYAGLCGNDNIQSNSDDYYHSRSFIQITTHLEGTGNCAAKTPSNNTPPTVVDVSLKSYTIPYKTSFELIASANDPDNDPINYCWEQFDRGSFGAWNAGNLVSEPLFRTFDPSPSPIRTFPKYTDLMLNRINVKGEVLPEVAREMNFKLIVRDIRNGYGTYNRSDNDLNVTVVNTSPDLFRVTSHSTPLMVWEGLTQQEITWNVAGTNTGSINTPTVDIFLSTDTGRTFPHVLATNVPNDGSEIVYAPNIPTTRGRIKVKGHNNIFFDLNDTYIQITQTTYPTGVNDLELSSVKVKPIPAQDVLFIETGNVSLTSLSLFNLLGQKVKEFGIESSVLDISSIHPGVYILHGISKNNLTFDRKIIIQ